MSFNKIIYKDNETIITADNLNNIQDAILEGYQPDGTIEAADFAPNAIVEAVYPIGSIYMSVNNVSPAMKFGGTWESINDKFLMCGGSTYGYGSTGGNAAHIHTTGNCTLTINQIPSHSHTNYYYGGSQVSWGYDYSNGKGTISNATPDSGGIGYTGGGQAHNHGNTGSTSNLPPYLTVYTWKRIA